MKMTEKQMNEARWHYQIWNKGKKEEFSDRKVYVVEKGEAPGPAGGGMAAKGLLWKTPTG